MGRFQSETIIKDSARTKSDILSQVDQVIEFVKKHINKEVIITGQACNYQKWQYPLEAIREIITNMVIHRDYRLSSDSIVKVFDDRIEFYNPGRLPDSISVEDLLSNNYKSTPRNKMIADFCKSIGLIEKYGSGIRRIVEYFKDAQLPSPEFRNISDGFMVTVFAHKEVNVPLSVPDDPDNVPDVPNIRMDKIVVVIGQNNEILLQELADILKVSKRTIRRDIEKLKLEGKLKRVGGEKTGHWEITR